MRNCVICPKKLIVKALVSMLDLKSKDISEQLHLSKSVISRYLNGERPCAAIDIYIIEETFGIKVKEYTVNDLFTK